MSSVFDKMTDSEKKVANFLTKVNLYWKYEFPVFVWDEKERTRLWTPDFFIPKLGLYVEVCGSENFDYDYRDQIYKKNEIYVIYVHTYKDEKEWTHFLVNRLEEINDYRAMKIQNMKGFYSE